MEDPGPTFHSKARQWSRAAWGLGLLFASLPLASWIMLGSWGFEGAGELAILCFAAGVYLQIRSRRKFRGLPDSAAMLGRAMELAREGRTNQALALLTRAIHLSPGLWQPYQYRGELHFRNNAPRAALDDLTQAIRLAPSEPHLFALRAYAYTLLGDEAAARKDYQTASALGGGRELPVID